MVLPSVKICPKQSLLDIAIQERGTLESTVELALLNDISITDALIPGNNLSTAVEAYDIEIATFYKRKQLTPATALDAIDYMLILFEAGLFETGIFD